MVEAAIGVCEAAAEFFPPAWRHSNLQDNKNAEGRAAY